MNDKKLTGSINGVGIEKWIYPALLFVVWLMAYIYVFDSDIDLNGDNAVYYVLARSLSQGLGYVDTSIGSVSNAFPPGYPLLMTPLMWFTDSIIAQKILNGLFMLAAVMVLYCVVVKSGFSRSLALIIGAGMILSERVLHFATIMMSEMSFLLCSALVVLALMKRDDSRAFWRDKWFYILLFALVYAYHIRTQGIALVGAVVLFFLFRFRANWRELLSLIGGFVVLCLPWVIRNKLAGVPQSRYFETIQQVNPFRPEDGALDLSGIVERFFDTIGMLISQALPNSIIPNVPYSLIGSFDGAVNQDTPYLRLMIDYSEQPQTLGLWLIGLVSLSLICYGFWQFRRLRWFLLGYLILTFGIIAIFSTPSGNRYITTLIPILTIGQLVGIYTVLCRIWQRFMRKNRQTVLSAWFVLPLLLLCKGSVSYLHRVNVEPLPPAYTNYIEIARAVRENCSPSTVVVCRKPQFFHLYSGTLTQNYLYTSNDTLLVRDLVEKKAEYVIVEQLGFSSTGLYLVPAIQKNPQLFDLVMHLPEPDTYLLRFNINEARKK